MEKICYIWKRAWRKSLYYFKIKFSLWDISKEKNQRIKTSGSGLQFVHGGASPQEMIIPLINYKSGANSKKISKVQVRIRESVAKITSNLTKCCISNRGCEPKVVF